MRTLQEIYNDYSYPDGNGDNGIYPYWEIDVLVSEAHSVEPR